MKALGPAAILLLVLTRAASADSDGYFCIGKGYLAWELREWSAPERRHVLRVLFVGGIDGVSEVRTAPLDDYQVHGMTCRASEIVLISWDRKVTLTLAGSDAPRVTSVETFPAGRIPAGYEANSLGAIRTERTLEVPSSRKDRQYLLRIHYSEKLGGSDHAGVRFHESTATLVEKNEDGRVIREKSVYRDEREEPVD